MIIERSCPFERLTWRGSRVTTDFATAAVKDWCIVGMSQRCSQRARATETGSVPSVRRANSLRAPGTCQGHRTLQYVGVGVSGIISGGSIVNSGSGIISGERRGRWDTRCATAMASPSRMRRCTWRSSCRYLGIEIRFLDQLSTPLILKLCYRKLKSF